MTSKYKKTMSEALNEVRKTTIEAFDIAFDVDGAIGFRDVEQMKSDLKKKGINVSAALGSKKNTVTFQGGNKDAIIKALHALDYTTEAKEEEKVKAKEEEKPEEEEQEVEKEEDKEAILAKQKEQEGANKEKEIEKLKDEIQKLKLELENEKNAKIKPEPNPDTGEIPLKIGVAYKHFKDKQKKDEVKEDHEISMARGQLEAIADKALRLSSIMKSKSDEDQLEAWVQSKITKASDYIAKVADYLEYNPDVAEAILHGRDFKYDGKGPIKISKQNYAKVQKHSKSTINGKPYMMALNPKTQGTELVPVQFEELEESFSDAMIQRLKKEYEPMRGKTISVTNANKLGALFTKFDKDKNALEKLYGGNIPFISTMAMTRLMTKHNYKAADLNKIRKEEVEYEELVEFTKKDFARNEDDNAHTENGVQLAKMFGTSAEKSTMAQIAKAHHQRGHILSHEIDKRNAIIKKYYNRLKEEIDVEAEADLTKPQIKKVHKLADKLPKKSFKDRYGKDGDSVRYGTATNMIKKKMNMKEYKEYLEYMAKNSSQARQIGNMFKGKTGGGEINISGSEVRIDSAKDVESIHKQVVAKFPDVNVMTAEQVDGDDSYPPNQINKMKHKENPKKSKGEHPAKMTYETIKAVKNKAEKTGMPYGILKKVYDRGMAAWRGGHRPGATQQQWALARVNSFVTKSSGTWGGADKDLAAKVKGK